MQLRIDCQDNLCNQGWIVKRISVIKDGLSREAV